MNFDKIKIMTSQAKTMKLFKDKDDMCFVESTHRNFFRRLKYFTGTAECRKINNDLGEKSLQSYGAFGI